MGYLAHSLKPATEGVVDRPARANLLGAEQTRATSMLPEPCCDLLERQRSFNKAVLCCLWTNHFVHFFVVGLSIEGQHGSQEPYRDEDLFNSRWTVQTSIAPPKTILANRRCAMTPPSAVNMVNTTTSRRENQHRSFHDEDLSNVNKRNTYCKKLLRPHIAKNAPVTAEQDSTSGVELVLNIWRYVVVANVSLKNTPPRARPVTGYPPERWNVDQPQRTI